MDTFICIASNQDSMFQKRKEKKKKRRVSKDQMTYLFPSIFSITRWTIMAMVRPLTT